MPVKRWLPRGLLCVGAGFISLFGFFLLAAQAALEDLSIDNTALIVVSSTRVNRTEFDLTYRAKITNAGTQDMSGVTATLTSLATSTQVIQGRLTFGEVLAGSTVTSSDTFTIRQDRSFPFRPANLSWQITGTIKPPIPPALSLDITNPTQGATTTDNTIIVRGTFQGPMNTGITVNGVIAGIDGNRYSANVPLELGTNTLTALASAPDGRTASKSIDIVSLNISLFEIAVSPARGVAPLAVQFKLSNLSGSALTQIKADYEGAGRVDFTTAQIDDPFEYVYTRPGLYQATFSFTDTQNITYTKTILIAVYDAVKMDQMFQTTWSSMNNALLAGNKSQAMQFLNAQAQEKYSPVFDALMPFFSQIISSYSPLQPVSLSESIGEYAINRTIDEVNRIFLIYFLQDVDGVWKIDSM